MNLVGALSETVTPADPLLDTHRVPGEVVVYEDVAVLKVKSLTRDLAGEEYLEFASSKLRPDALPALLTPAAVLVPGGRGAVHQLKRIASFSKLSRKVVKSAPEGGKDHHPVRPQVAECVLQYFQERFQLSVL